MFDVGFAELILLFVIGLLVLGPDRFPKVPRPLGGLTRKARSSWLNLKRSIEDEIRAEEIRKPLEQFQSDMRSKVDDMSRKANVLRDDVLAKEDASETEPTPPKESAGDKPE